MALTAARTSRLSNCTPNLMIQENFIGIGWSQTDPTNVSVAFISTTTSPTPNLDFGLNSVRRIALKCIESWQRTWILTVVRYWCRGYIVSSFYMSIVISYAGDDVLFLLLLKMLIFGSTEKKPGLPAITLGRATIRSLSFAMLLPVTVSCRLLSRMRSRSPYSGSLPLSNPFPRTSQFLCLRWGGVTFFETSAFRNSKC